VPFSNVKCYFSNVPLSVVKCENCGLVYLNPRPDKKLGLEYFENAYSNATGFESHSYYRDHDKIFNRSQARFDLIKNLEAPNHKILDFGAGQGHFVKTAIDNKWDATGIELSNAAIQAARENFNIELLSSLQNLKINDFGVIALWDVIEHLEDPKGILRELTKYLHPDGYFVIETSNIDSLDYLAHKKKWSYWHVDHLFYFSRKTLVYLLKTLSFSVANPSLPKTSGTLLPGSRFAKYKILVKPSEFIFAIKKKWLSLRFKDFDKNSLMTVVFKR